MITNRQNRDIRNILAVLGTAVMCAGLLAFAFLHYYSPSGQYFAGNTLLDPTIIEQINYPDQHPRMGRKVRFSFDHIEFSYFMPQKGDMHVSSIPLETYQKFYTNVASEKSLKEVDKETQDFFLRSHPSLLTIHMHTQEGNDNRTTKIFQVVQFVPEDYFRVQLHEKNEGEWAYFYRPGLYREIMDLFTPSKNL